ncbi:MAG: sulfotransferase [Gemmatimonadales bacterium]|nr:sulfotransferase [Gemmatimonadales bacterium]MBA3553154.1 sulfotransferase [Gemmatimonadales bacterium]
MASQNGAAEVERTRIKYVCLPGSRFTGSTLLGSLLNEHPDCSSIGAATGLIRRTDLRTYQCSCGELFRKCEFWNSIEARTRTLGYPVNVFDTNFWNTHLRLSRNRVVNGWLARSLGWDPLNRVRDSIVGKSPRARAAISKMGWNTWSLASAVLGRTGKTVFVDTARDHQRPKYLHPHPMLEVKVIHLVRDPRGNSASIVKHTGVDIATAARQWTHSNAEAARIRRHLPQESWMSLHYEALCADPAGVLDRISDFLGIGRPSLQQGFRNGVSHIIGNKMRMKGLAEIREDLSWQTTLGGAELSTIASISGSTSRSLGYNWP